MSTRYHIGARRLESSLAAYAKRFDFLEVPMPARGRPAPTPATLKRWRKQVPPHFDFSVVVGPAASELKAGAELDHDLEAAMHAADALQARCMLVVTPPTVTPAAVWRDRLEKVTARLARDATLVAWEPRGLWEIDDARRVAHKLGVVLVVDPSRDPVPEGPVAYTRLRALGETRSYGATALERVVEAVGVRRDAYVVIETQSALAECKLLRRLGQGTGRKQGGMGRVIRPREAAAALAASLRVKDDEQE
ncbi:MAG TPA: DUF72 domain-containing protein [Polyangiaceae bacterium]|jgi:uncharacterized protein YecE (DUF72 family)